MLVTKTATYALSADQIMAIIADEQFQNEKCEKSFALQWEASTTTGATPGDVTVQTQRAMPTEHLPDIAKGFIGDRFVIHEAQNWSGPDAAGRYSAELRIHVQGAPLTGTGRRSLSPTNDGGSKDEISLDIKASIPLIGRRVEEAAMPAVEAAIEIETELLASRADA